jgi:ATP-binding protein involved in chromosome partitioning
MPLREHADGGVPLVIADPDDPAAEAIRRVARGLIAMAPLDPPALPPLDLVDGGALIDEPVPQARRKPAGMSLPMA